VIREKPASRVFKINHNLVQKNSRRRRRMSRDQVIREKPASRGTVVAVTIPKVSETGTTEEKL
jgi:hypothetical protein